MTTYDPVKRMQKVFEKHRYKYDPCSLFERFLEFIIVGFDSTFSTPEKPFDKEEAEICMELYAEWTQIMQDQLRHKDWYDLLGEVYMQYLSGVMKKHWTGQYFTPMHISDFMAKITDPGEKVGEMIMDNACGSGRMLLASHVLHPGNYCCAQDLDRICCLMTVCNFIIHGVNGEVICGDALNPVDFREGWRTNELLNKIGIPTVRKMDKLESIAYMRGLQMLQKSQSVTPEPKKKAEPVQLSLFDFE